tara:strand:- start:75 stop:281 length:207 start_codon:yes stop_codon:yes gene_type:complete
MKKKYIYENDYMPVTSEDIKWAIDSAIQSAGALDHEPKAAYFDRIKNYAINILKTKKQLSDEVDGSIY